jgi:hypothetical protein
MPARKCVALLVLTITSIAGMMQSFWYRRKSMIGINNLTISTKAAVGSVVGTLKLLSSSLGQMPNVNFILNKNAAGFFSISGSNIVTTSPLIPPGLYSVRVNAVATKAWIDDNACFMITVTAS